MLNLDLDNDSASMKVKFKGQEYLLTSPSVGMIQKMQKAINDKKDEVDCIIELVEKCGLPKEIALEIPMNKLKLIIESLTDSEKKS